MGQQCSFGRDTVYSPPESPGAGTRDLKAVSYNYTRAQTTLRELFAAIRTGLVVSEAEFSVLPPAIATSAKIKFSLGACDAIENGAEEVGENTPEVEPEEPENGGGDEEEAEDEENEDENEEKGPYVLVTTLRGPGWAQGLQMQLTVRAIVGPFAHRVLLLSWRENTLRVEGSESGELNPRTIPDAFEDETDFCKCCLLLAYHSDSSGKFNAEEAEKQSESGPCETSIVPLKMAAYHTLIANLDAIPRDARLPPKVYHLLYGSQGPVDVTIRAWPDTHAALFGESPQMRVKSGILFAEFSCLLRARFNLPHTFSIKLYHNHMPVQYSNAVGASHTTIDCFVVERTGFDSLQGSYCSDLDEAGALVATNTGLVVSLVGYEMKNIVADLDMKMSDFDHLLRQRFSLREDSFLLVLAEDDYTPQYCSYDNWKCVYSFALPDTSFRAGLRRSMRRFSFSRRRSGNGLPQTPQEQVNAALQPHLHRVLELLSSNSRHFPSNLDRSDFSVEQLYQTMPMYEKTLDECSIHQYTIIQVFEVTGPSVPITFRVVSSSNHQQASHSAGSEGDHFATGSRTRLTNIMDINPDWPLSTFFRYVDAIVSPGSTSRRRRRLGMGERSLDSWEEENESMTLGQLLDQWKPTWWPIEGEERKPLTIKDVNPSEFLVVEKF